MRPTPSPDKVYLGGVRVLVVDDVWDSGSTIVAVRERLRKAGARVQTCVLHYKPGRSRYLGDGPDYYARPPTPGSCIPGTRRIPCPSSHSAGVSCPPPHPAQR